ncbi:MAG: dicarboxylate/amino acid:cation symporter [Gammaproteobacteria bacterium]|nr:dicarboxylate/amino acid:cation symporter [Gammaproteobacteria bacterium]MCP4832041.1 dicarboxylate/amino acid:cation symporter [Gammaproteobacteria bacterium]MCP4928358.1 dicarboxylate/amino acid:cation symporter [Gammaproteobacteria bacterium]
MMKLKLHWQILIAIFLGGLAGWLTGDTFALAGVTAYSVYEFVGTLFLNALKMLIVPLIASSIIVGVAGIGSSGNLGRLGSKTLGFYLLTTLAAIVVGLILLNLFKPGISDGQPVSNLLALDASTTEVADSVASHGANDLVNVVLRAVPPNIIAAAAEGQMLGIIFFCLLFGYFMTRLEHDYAQPLLRFWTGVFHVMMHITEWVMLFAPIGVFGLVARVVARTGFDAAAPLLAFAAVILLALTVHTFVTLPLLLRFVGGILPFRFIRMMSPAMLTAFSTASSSATLPITMECVEDGAKVPNQISSFVLPLGATVNMNGTALYECGAVLFLAQAYGVELGVMTQLLVVFTALITSIGVAGIPSASLVAIAIILAAVGLPVEAIAVLFVFDRVLDMVRTSVNVFGDSCCAVIVARLEGVSVADELMTAPETNG